MMISNLFPGQHGHLSLQRRKVEFVPHSTFTLWCAQERYAFTAQTDRSKHNLLMKITYKLAVTGRYQVHGLHGLEGLPPGMYPDGV